MEGEYGDPPVEVGLSVDVLVERRCPYAEALGQQSHGHVRKADLVGELRRAGDHDGRVETGSRHRRGP
jgi:hypothetical protein